MNIIAIDPGPTQSAYVVYHAEYQRISEKGIFGNEAILAIVGAHSNDPHASLVIEQVAAMGMAVGAEVFETVFWSGRFAQIWGRKFNRLKRHEIKMHLCQNMRAKDGNIRQALIDKLGPPGTVKAKGVTYGCSGDVWQALAVAVTYAEKFGERKVQELFQSAA